MEVILAVTYSAIIIFMTIFFILKACIIAYTRNDLSLRKLIVVSSSSITIGIIVIGVLPFIYEKIYDYIK